MSAFAFSINRNIMECNVPYYDEETTAITVLIETLWNVKVEIVLLSVLYATVLIETLWNVKKGLAHSSSDATIVLIETLWNVKSQTTYNKWVGATTY